MSRKDHLNPNQLKLFMSPEEILSSVHDSVDLGYGEDMGDLMEQKLSESKGTPRGSQDSLYDSISRHGVKRHVTLEQDPDGGLIMGQGHHRVAAAADLNKRFGRTIEIPVIYDDWNWNYSNEHEYRERYPQNIKFPEGYHDPGEVGI